MKTRIHRFKCILTALLSAAMVVWNVSAALPVYAAPAIEDFREDAELINDLVLPAAVQKKSRNRNASPSEATAVKEQQALFAGAAGWGTPSSATKILRTELDGVAIEASAPAGVLPEGAVLRARRLTDEEEREVLTRISEHADTEGKAVTTQFLCDLTVFNAAGKVVQPDSSRGKLVVSFRNVGIVAADSTEMGEGREYNADAAVSVLHIDETNNKVDTLREGLDANLPVLQVAAEHFSPFAVVNYRSATTPTLGVEFKMLDYDNDNRLDYRLKDVTVLDTAGNGISSMSIQVDSGYIDSIPDYVPGADSHDYKLFTDINANHLFYQIIFPTPLTPAEAKTFLENKLHFHLASQGANQQLTISLGNGPSRFPQNATIKLTKATIPNPMPGDSAEHYYMYVEPQPKRLISWAESYNLAKQTYLDGMQGYLVTVTSAVEDDILNQVTATNIGAWSGGARFEGINDSDSVPNWTDNLAPGRTAGSVFANQSLSGSTGSGAHRRFRWQNGPETGIEYYEQGNGGSTPTGNGHALNTPYGSYSHFEPTGGMTYEPNSSGGMHGGPYVSGYESVMQVHNAGHWNDLHNVSEYTGGGLDVKGFYIEFSGYKKTGSTSEQVVSLHTASTVYAEQNGQQYYFQTADEAVTWAGQNGNAPLTLIGDTTLTGDIPANVSLDLNGHTLTVPAGSSVVNHGSIDASNPASQLYIQGSYGGFRNMGSGSVTRQLTVRMNDRTVTATEPLTWSTADATVTGLLGNDRACALTVNFDNSSTADVHPTLPVSAENPTGFDNGSAGSTAIGTYTVTYLPGTVTRNPHQYTVKFLANTPGGQTVTGTMPDQHMVGNASADLQNRFAVNGYTFSGWTGSDGQTYADGATPSLLSRQNGAVVTMTANWTKNTYTIRYTDNVHPASRTAPGTNPNTVSSYEVTDTDINLAPMVWQGYTFDGWYEDPAFTGAPVTRLITNHTPAGNRHYYAKWTQKRYALTYHLNDATPAGYPASNPNAGFTGYTVETPNYALAAPNRAGYPFEGWFTDAALTVPAPTVIDTTQGDTNPTDYYAKWGAALPYAIEYHLNDDTPAGHAARNSASNPNGFRVTDPDISLQAPVRTGYVFEGWYRDPGFTTSIRTIHPVSAQDHTVYAKWSNPIRYTVQWDLNDGTLSGPPAVNPNGGMTGYTVEDADFVMQPASRPGYAFEGWYDNAALLGAPVTALRTMDAENKHYYAKWSAPLQYPVRYVLNDSAANPATVPASNLLRYSIETNGGGTIHLNPAFRQGFDFLGWYDNAAFAGAPVADFPATDAVPKTYYAKWQIKSYRLQYHLNGGSGSHMPINPAVNPDRYTIEGAVPLVPPQRQGYTGIWVENGQTVTNIPAGSTGDRTLTAVWTLNRYPLYYELGETVNSRVEGLPALPQSYTAEDADITLPTPHRIGYTFLRWEKSGAPGVADNRIQAGSAGELTFRAIWEPIRYRIHYDTAGGTNNTQNPTTFTIEDEVSPYGSVKQGMRFWTWQLVGGKFIHTIPAGTTHDIALVARYQKDRDSDNIGGGNSSGSNNSGSGERQQQPLPDGVVNKKDQERKTVNAGSEDGERIEPVPQKRADARAEVLHESVSPEHGERNAKLAAATESFEQHRHARLPKTGEMPFRIPMAFLLFVSLLASNLSYVLYAIRGFGKKKAEWF